MCTLTLTRPVTYEELKELCVLMEAQQTTDRHTDTGMFIDGDYAEIEVDIDEDGNVTLN